MHTPLRKIRLENNLTISDVDSAVNCDVRNISRLERGIQTTPIEMAEKLAKFYQGKINELQILYPHRYM